MNLPQFRFQLLYTSVAGTALLVMAIIVSLFAIGPIADKGSALSWTLHALLAASGFLLLDPTRRLVLRLAHRSARKKPINYSLFERDLTNLFLEQVDLFETAAELTKMLKYTFRLTDVQLVISHRGTFQRIREHSEITIQGDPLLDHLQEFATQDEELYWHKGSVRSEDHSHHRLRSYFEKNNIVYVMPLFIDQKLFGYITLHHKSIAPRFLAEDREFLRRMRSLIAVALRRVHIDRKLNHRIGELEMLNRISYTMNSSLNVQETIEVVMDAVIELTHADRAIMYLRDEDPEYFTPAIGRNIEDVTLNFSVKVSESIFSHVVRTREAIIVEDPMNDPRVNKEYAARVKTKAFVIAPMVINEEVIGIIGVDNLHSGRSVQNIEVDLLMTLANQVAIAISNSRHHETVEKFNDELQEKVKEATEDLQKMIDTQSHFLTVASHQLRTPSTVARGLLSMMIEDPEMKKEERHKYALQAFQSMTRLQRIISELLSATELEGKVMRPYIEEVDTHVLVKDIVDELTPLANERNIAVTAKVVEGESTVLNTDRFRLQEALSNLVDNAIRYTVEGSVSISVDHGDEHVTFTVRDTGVGLTTEDKQVIFEKFQRGASITDIAPNGSGLGLFIAQKITEMLEGSIRAESKGENQGATFILTVPKTQAKSDD